MNLLLANQKRSQEPGDNQQMISHRRQFFNTGLYQPLSNAINKMILPFLGSQPGDGRFHLLDSGCGEGYFLHRLDKVLGEGERPYPTPSSFAC